MNCWNQWTIIRKAVDLLKYYIYFVSKLDELDIYIEQKLNLETELLLMNERENERDMLPHEETATTS